MALLKQISDSLAYYQGWYGTCPEYDNYNCDNFTLIAGSAPNLFKKYPEILKIELISGNAEASVGYSGTIEDGAFLAYQQITELQCGRAYRIILSKGTNEIEIPEFSFANADSIDEYRLTNQCMPPTPTPTPFECCGDRTQNVRPNQDSVNNLTCVGNINGTLCWNEMTGHQFPKTYLCSFEDEDFDESGLKITISANITNPRFRFTKDNGKCYETALFHQDNEGLNIFQIIT